MTLPALVTAGVFVCVPAIAAPTVYNLGLLPTGTESRAGGLTPDGWTVSGSANTATSFSRSFRWTLSGGMTDLGPPPLGSPWTAANSISATGNAVAGNGGNSLFRWTSAGGMQNLGIWPSSTVGLARGISANGNIVVGWSNNNGFGGQAALRWAGAGLQLLPALPGGLSIGNMPSASAPTARSSSAPAAGPAPAFALFDGSAQGPSFRISARFPAAPTLAVATAAPTTPPSSAPVRGSARANARSAGPAPAAW
ncbi:MAG: hypothetical protein ACK5WB_10675 [Phycisphaerales bacterium]|jgi:hypothetical protein